jgi:hypothetical protein
MPQMPTAAACPPSQPVPQNDVTATLEWQAACEYHCNLLIQAPQAAADDFLRRLLPHLRSPIHHARADSFTLPTRAVSTVVLQNVTQMPTIEQNMLRAWMANPRHTAQLISTATEPVYPLVQQGRFPAWLYYRLNVVLLQIDNDSPVVLSSIGDASRG